MQINVNFCELEALTLMSASKSATKSETYAAPNVLTERLTPHGVARTDKRAPVT